MSDEPKTTQQKLDALIQQMETNGRLAEEQAAMLPACFAAIEDGATFDLVAETFRTFRKMWAKHHPDVERLFSTLCNLVEREKVRRALTEGYEVGTLVRISQL
jgi:hypothetical protein